MLDFLLDYDIQTHLTAFVLGSARLMTFAIVAPFMGNAVLNTTAKSALVLSLYLVVHPVVLANLPATFPMTGSETVLMAGLIAKEVFIGFALGWLSGLIFWAIESGGMFIDNQRGASAANETNYMSGTQSTPTGAFLFHSCTYVFFASGTFLAFLGLLYSTYEFWPVHEFLPSQFFLKEGAALFFGERMAELAVNMVLISAPVVLACLFTDISLGLINRFASQLNVYVLAMPIKSALASFLLIFYFAVLMTDAPERFAAFGIDVSALRVWLK